MVSDGKPTKKPQQKKLLFQDALQTKGKYCLKGQYAGMGLTILPQSTEELGIV